MYLPLYSIECIQQTYMQHTLSRAELYPSAVLTQINVNVYHYMSVHHCIWLFTHALYEHVKLSCVAESAAPLHVACGLWSRCGGILQWELLVLIHCSCVREA